MNFFEHQEHARRNTALLAVLFVLAVLAVLALMNLLAAVIYVEFSRFPVGLFRQLTPKWVYATATVITLGAIVLGWGLRTNELAGGGAALARLMGARRASRALDPNERRLCNVVEEMAIASGVEVPQVFVLRHEAGINALAAGYAPNEAAVIVTQGVIEHLSRDEMQGIIAHEFSHILNGDMRMNLRVVSVIAGIGLMGNTGRFLTNIWMLSWIGAPMWLAGLAGVLAGRAIRMGISRQREYLADAASVQFTRNPDGIASALHKMQRHGGRISERRSEELSHMFFGAPFTAWFWDAHPSVERRLERVLGKRWRSFVRQREREAAPPPAPLPSGELRTNPQALFETVGNPSSAHVEAARALLARIPDPVRKALESSEGAAAVLVALLVADPASRAARLEVARAQAGDAAAQRAASLAQTLDGSGPELRMPLLELAMPALKAAEPAQQDKLVALAQALMSSGGKASLADFVLLTLCRRHLGVRHDRFPPVKHHSFLPVAEPAAVVISLLVHGSRSGEGAFHSAMAHLGLGGQRLRAVRELNLAAVERALYELKLLAPARKALLVKCGLAIVVADERITTAEGELMRAVCASIDAPLPPLIQRAAP